MKIFIKIIALFLAVGLTSCNTVFRAKTQSINIFSNASEAKITVNDSVYKLPATIKLLRAKQPVTISYASQNKTLDTIITPRTGPLFYLGNLVTSPFFGAGYWVDLMNHKRYQYRKNIFINDKEGLAIQEYKADRYIAKHQITDTVKQLEVRTHINKHFEAAAIKKEQSEKRLFKKFNPTEGTFRFNIQPPTLFLIGLSNKNGNIESFSNTVGGAGFGLGFDYYYKNNRFIGLETSLRGNVFDVMWWSSYDIKAYKYDISIRKGHRWKRFEFSYGPSFTYTDYDYKVPYKEIAPIQAFTSEDNRRNFDVNYRTLGFSSLFNYQLTSVMFVGVRYNPSIYSFRETGNGFDYEHVIGIDYRIKI